MSLVLPAFTMGVLAKAVSLLASITALDQAITNGFSVLGTLDAHLLPKFLSDDFSSDVVPWGDQTVRNTNPYRNSPDSGRTRVYDFTLKRARLAPDGFEREMTLINGQYPGPTIEGEANSDSMATMN